VAKQKSQKSARGSKRDRDESQYDEKFIKSKNCGNHFHYGESTPHISQASTGAISQLHLHE